MLFRGSYPRIKYQELIGIIWRIIFYICVLVLDMINLFMFVGNWDILTLLVMRDIMYFMLVTSCGINVMYGVIFVLVADLVVCIYVIYL